MSEAPKKMPPPMTRAAWLKTPYAGTTAQRTEEHVERLLERYGILQYQWTQGNGPNGRAAMMLRFELKGKAYRIMLEAMNAVASRQELVAQLKRAIFYHLKSSLEMASVFMPPEKVLFAFLELPGGFTCFEAAEESLKKLESPDFAQLMLPAPGRDGGAA